MQSGDNSGIIDNTQGNVSETAVSKYSAEDKKAAILRYKSGESYIVNAKLREGESLEADEQDFVEALDEALKELPVYEGLVYRNLTFDDFGGQEAFNEFLEQYVPNEPVFYQQFISCSKKQDGYPVEGNFKVQLIIESKGARDVAGYGNNMESEVIYPLNSVFIVDRIENNASQPIIYLQEVLNNGYYATEEQGNAVRELQKSYTANSNLQGISEGDTVGNTWGSIRPQPTTPTGQRDTVRTERRQGTILPTQRQEQTKSVNTQADPNGPANFMPETDNTESGDVGFSSPSDQEIYRESTDKEKYDAMFGKRKDAKQRHILDVAKKLDSGLKVVFVDPDNKMLSGRAGVFMPDSKTIYLSNDNSVVGMYCQLFKHEFVHRLELKKAYQSFKNYLFRNSSVFERYVRSRLKQINGTEFDGTREEALKALSSYYLNLVRNGDFKPEYKRSFTAEYAEREMVADFVGEVLFKGKKNHDDIAQNLADSELGEVLKLEDTFAEFENLNETERGWFRKMIDAIKDFISSLKGIKQNKRLVEDLEYIEKRLARVLDSKDTKKAAKQNGGTVNYSIVYDSKNRKVVMLDRNIFDSIQDLEERAEKLEDWIINKFGGQKFNTSDYFFLIVNERTAGKMKFWSENMDEMLYKRKLSAAEHIDELIKISKFDRYSKNVKDKHKEFAKMGWNYFKSYFTDGIRTYEADISVAKTKEQSVVYNIGYIKDVGKFLQKNKSPDSFTGSPNELVTILGNEASNWDSNNKIPHKEDSVKNNISKKDENYSDISDIKQQFSLSTPAKQQRENLDKYERGEITREEYLEETDRLWGEANEKYGSLPKKSIKKSI